MFVIEAAIDRAAEVMGIPRSAIQAKNLLREGDAFPYGMKVERSRARRSFDEAVERFDLEALETEIADHNACNRLVKRGVAVMPVCFGISFTNAILNQAGALVHVYTDGSVSVSTGAVEMGQGVNAKILARGGRDPRAADGPHPDREHHHDDRVANTSPTAASSGADINGHATELACRAISNRLLSVAAELLDISPDRLSISDGRGRWPTASPPSSSGTSWSGPPTPSGSTSRPTPTTPPRVSGTTRRPSRASPSPTTSSAPRSSR